MGSVDGVGSLQTKVISTPSCLANILFTMDDAEALRAT
jgi:hypothetical protein